MLGRDFERKNRLNWSFQSVPPSRMIYAHPVLYFTTQITKKYCTAMCYLGDILVISNSKRSCANIEKKNMIWST